MNFFKRLKRFHIGRYEFYLLGLVLFGVALRMMFIAFNWPTTNSDEGTMGLIAIHIADKGEWPIFFYGQFYMGTIEGYISALLFRVFGSSLFMLRFSLLPFFAMFLICMYGLTSLLQSKRFALFTTLFFSFGTGGVVLLQMRAIGGYPETEAFAAAICLLVVWLALSRPLDVSTRHAKLLRIGGYGAFGLLSGLAMWTDLLILPFVCMGVIFLLLFCWREFFSWSGLSLFVGVMIGLLPLIIYNLQVPYDQSSLYELLVLHSGNGDANPRFLMHVVGAFALGLPQILNYGPACPQSSFPFFGQVDLPCVLLQTSWSVGYLILCAVVVGTALLVLWKLWRGQKGTSLLAFTRTWEYRQCMIRECGRLMVIICSLGTFLLYLTSTPVAIAPGTAFRYLICMLVSVPTALWPLWNGIHPLSFSTTWKKRLPDFVRISLLALVLCMSMYGTYHIIKDDIPTNQKTYHQQLVLAQHLTSLHIKYIYSEYWTCDKLVFITNENIICSVLSDKLRPGFNRYPLYQKMVDASSSPSYVFPDTAPQAQIFAQDIAQNKFKTTYRRTLLSGYTIYTPLK